MNIDVATKDQRNMFHALRDTICKADKDMSLTAKEGVKLYLKLRTAEDYPEMMIERFAGTRSLGFWPKEFRLKEITVEDANNLIACTESLMAKWGVKI